MTTPGMPVSGPGKFSQRTDRQPMAREEFARPRRTPPLRLQFFDQQRALARGYQQFVAMRGEDRVPCPIARDGRIGAAEGSNVRVSNQNSSVVLPVVASDAVPRGTALVPFNQPGADARELVRHGDAVTDVRIEII